ncbi:MAG TPA: thermonuclease family protein [Pyrinomonadaceae bacterium]|nr:thermonuclease family protein [Pyrinomonadaceae bacterium]
MKDGDTIAVLDDNNDTHDIRLHAVDAPEKKQDFSNVSRRHLSELIAGKKVLVEYNPNINSHERLIGKVTIDGLDVGLEQIKAGLAWHAKEFANEQTELDREAYALAEKEARANKRGLWQYPSPVPPWEYRDSSKQNASKVQYEPQTATSPESSSGSIIGNKRSMIYHWPGCPYYKDIAPSNRVYFKSPEEAEKAGFRPARNCPTPF